MTITYEQPIEGGPIAGEFTLVFHGAEGTLPFDATAKEVQEVADKLPEIARGREIIAEHFDL